MTNSPEIPLWLQPVQLEEWPTQMIENAALGYHLPIPPGWQINPMVNQTDLEIEHIFRGDAVSEGLLISCMNQADPRSNLCTWVEAFLSLTGFPILALKQSSDPPPELLEWQYQGNCPALTERLNCDETHLYQGLAQFPGKPPELARLYILLARRNSVAWKVSLSLMSACLPGMPEEKVASNDHLRAGAIFGELCLL